MIVALLLPALALGAVGALPVWAAEEGAAPATQPAKADANTPAPKPEEPKTDLKAEPTEEGPATQPVSDGEVYQVGKFELSYGREHPQHPALEPFLHVPIVLGKTDQGYVAGRKGVPAVTVCLADFKGDKAEGFFASAIRAINEQIVAAFNRRGLVGIFVAPHADDLDSQTGKDSRQAGNTTLRLVVWSASVSRVRTLASGERIPTDERIDHPKHARILAGSPLEPNDLLRKDKLDDHVFFLNRHPGRRVDAVVTSGEKAGQVALDYLVSESKPWLAYAQASNTGTEATSDWRFRFGFIHNQVTNRDDILSAEYTTSCFDDPKTQSAGGSYEAPFFGMDRLRWRVYGSWAEYDAAIKSGVGFGEDWTGYEWRLGGEMIPNLWQHRETFLDAVLGAYWWRVHVDNQTLQQKGDADLFVPYVGLRLERITEPATTVGSATLEWNCQGIANSDEQDLERLGRTRPDADWVVLHWDVLHSFYLEPLLNPGGWRDASTPESSTLAHELAFQFRGQYAMSGYRLIPQGQRVAGGFFSVRGYPESIAAGDTALIGTAEYRLHLPRLLKIEKDPAKTPLPLVGTPFRWSPQTVYGRPDWDLILRAFLDAGRTMNSWGRSFEENQTLMGAGIGLEIQFTRYMNVRCDVGLPCRDLDTVTHKVTPGDPRFHIVATILF